MQMLLQPGLAGFAAGRAERILKTFYLEIVFRIFNICMVSPSRAGFCFSSSIIRKDRAGHCTRGESGWLGPR